MGIPTYFRYLFEKYSNTIIQIDNKPNNHSYNYFFIDFNSICYNCYNDNPTVSKDLLMKNIFDYTLDLCKKVNPNKLLYISVDGPIPLAKIHQQRSRRYKAKQQDSFLLSSQAASSASSSSSASISHLIAPGTQFMCSLMQYFESRLDQITQNLQHHPQVIFSSASKIGEGEHKIMLELRKRKSRILSEDDTTAVFSPDNDLLSLLMLIDIPKLFLVRFIDSQMRRLFRLQPLSSSSNRLKKLVYISIDEISSKFELEQQKKLNIEFDKFSLLLDYNFILSICGNDFVQVVPYLRIKNDGLSKLLNIYLDILHKQESYLIDKDSFQVNKLFLLEFFNQLKKREHREWQELQKFIQSQRTNPDTSIDEDTSLSLKQKKENKLSHLYMCNPSHPYFDYYNKDFMKLESAILSNDVKTFKQMYYSHFLNQSNSQQIQREKKKMVVEYLSSLKFTLLYYNQNQTPSYEWFYRYRCPPLFSDVVYFLEKDIVDMNNIQFRKGKVYSPLEQLLYILPRDSIQTLLPDTNELHFLMNKYCKHIDTTSIKVDALLGLKYIYSEAIFDHSFTSFSSMRHDIDRTELSKHIRFQISDE